ncbi:MAG: 2,5-diketo-D-gluconate reductase B [Candidatus Nanohaloarchaea archaeon]|jgi:2,5-diketo-D-gluconate reductase B
MEYLELQNQKIPVLGFGTWQLTGEECVNGVETALEKGYRHIDTAQIYGNEKQVGKGIESSNVDREEIWLTTKVWRDNLNREKLKESVEKSLEKLGADYVDLLLIHWPFEEMDLEAVVNEMNELVDEGKVRNIGVSNFTPGQMEEAQKYSEKPILTNQIEYHPFLDQSEILDKCREHDMMLTAYSPLARGDVLGNKTLQNIGEKHGKSEVQVALRWLIQQDNVSAIPKATSEEHIVQNLDIFDFELTGKEMETISELAGNDRKVDPDFGPWN